MCSASTSILIAEKHWEPIWVPTSYVCQHLLGHWFSHRGSEAAKLQSLRAPQPGQLSGSVSPPPLLWPRCCFSKAPAQPWPITDSTGMTGSSWIFFPRSFPGNWGTERNVRIWKLVKLICYGFTIFTVAVCLTVLLSQKISLLNIDSSTSCFLSSPPSGQGSQAQSPAKA